MPLVDATSPDPTRPNSALSSLRVPNAHVHGDSDNISIIVGFSLFIGFNPYSRCWLANSNSFGDHNRASIIIIITATHVDLGLLQRNFFCSIDNSQHQTKLRSVIFFTIFYYCSSLYVSSRICNNHACSQFLS